VQGQFSSLLVERLQVFLVAPGRDGIRRCLDNPVKDGCRLGIPGSEEGHATLQDCTELVDRLLQTERLRSVEKLAQRFIKAGQAVFGRQTQVSAGGIVERWQMRQQLTAEERIGMQFDVNGIRKAHRQPILFLPFALPPPLLPDTEAFLQPGQYDFLECLQRNPGEQVQPNDDDLVGGEGLFHLDLYLPLSQQLLSSGLAQRSLDSGPEFSLDRGDGIGRDGLDG